VRRRRERGTSRAASILLALLLAPGAAGAEMGGDDYRSPHALGSEAERRRVAEELERQRQREAEAQARLAAEARARAEAERQRLLARPLGERLVEARCTACHRADVVSGARHTVAGWRFVVERMRWWHRADVAPHEAAVIVDHLARAQPAPPARTWLEWGIIVALAALPLGGAVGLYRQRRRKGGR